MTNPRHALRAAVRAALLPCVAAAGWLPTGVLAQSSPAGELEEIVVTARKQTEALQSVPVAITALGGETLEQNHVSELVDVVKFLPSVTIQTSGPGFSCRISRVSSNVSCINCFCFCSSVSSIGASLSSSSSEMGCGT